MRRLLNRGQITVIGLVGLILLASTFQTSVLGQDSASGEALFNDKCAMCHTVGGGKSMGPDLKGVTDIRTHAWLVRMIVDPDALHSEGDPIATELQQEFGMPMPNVGISRAEAESILMFLSGGSAPAVENPPVAADETATSETGTGSIDETEPAEEAVDEDESVEEEATETTTTDEMSGDPFVNRGEGIFNQRCSACHSIGGGRKIGADLLGVTRIRDREWIKEILMDPSVFKMPMPQFGLPESDIEAVLEYIESHEVGSEPSFTNSIGKPVPDSVVGNGEADAVLDYIFGEDRADKPKTAALGQPKAWKDIPGVARILVVVASVIFVILLLSIMLEATFRKKPHDN